MATHHDDRHSPDKRPAFMGLVIGALALFAVAYTIVQLTNRAFEGHQPAAATQPAH